MLRAKATRLDDCELRFLEPWVKMSSSPPLSSLCRILCRWTQIVYLAHLWLTNQRERNQSIIETSLFPCLLQRNSQYQDTVPTQVSSAPEWERKIHIYVNIIQAQERLKLCCCSATQKKLEGILLSISKSGTEEQIQHFLISEESRPVIAISREAERA